MDGDSLLRHCALRHPLPRHRPQAYCHRLQPSNGEGGALRAGDRSSGYVHRLQCTGAHSWLAGIHLLLVVDLLLHPVRLGNSPLQPCCSNEEGEGDARAARPAVVTYRVAIASLLRGCHLHGLRPQVLGADVPPAGDEGSQGAGGEVCASEEGPRCGARYAPVEDVPRRLHHNDQHVGAHHGWPGLRAGQWGALPPEAGGSC
mmetsp:Transcript_12293/g.33585  ORF Transcript_12293/g.33585 Transcript_12293/m.33585 type:complete len:202 (+) Transcript_12293:937-1542(+)